MERSLKMLAKEAKTRMKRGFWEKCEKDLDACRREYPFEMGRDKL